MSLKNKKDFEELMPYEKLEMYGEKSLKTYELLAIIIKMGTKSKSAIDISKEILNSGNYNNNLNFLDEMTLKDLMKISGIGRVKAIQIKATIELAKRINKSHNVQRIKVNSTTDVLNLFMDELRYEKQELLKLIILNHKNEIIKIKEISKGNTNSISVDIKMILEEPIKLQAPKIILIHNHPSGDPTPSQEDFVTTEKIKKCAEMMGIQLLEHIIIGNGTYKNII